jgi:hypothetical protein
MLWVWSWMAEIGTPAALVAHSEARAVGFRKLEHFEGARPVRHPAQEPALLERQDQPVNARLGLEIEGVLHLLEGRRHAVLFQPLIDEEKEFELLACEHRWDPACTAASSISIRNKT